nr:protein rolling stone-like [Onthophagus taurus]
MGEYCINSDKLKFIYHDPYIFLKSEWQTCFGPSYYYLVYRWINVLYLFFTWILSMIDPNNQDCTDWRCKFKWLIYITDWSYTVILVQAVICTVGLTNWTVCYENCNPWNVPDCAFTWYRIYWATNILATDLAVGVTIIYWTLVFDSSYMLIDFVNISIHSLNTVVIILDLLIVSHPIYFTQCYVTIIFMTIYTIFTYLYHLCGGTNHRKFEYIYKILDWKYPKTCFMVVGGVGVVIVVLHGGICILQVVRSLLGNILNGNINQRDLEIIISL